MNSQDATQPTHTLNDLRGHLMATLAGLRDKQNPMSVDVARAMAQVGSVLVDTAKVEVDYIRATKGRTSAFMQITQPALAGYGSPRTSATNGAKTQHASIEREPSPPQAPRADAQDPQDPPAGPAAIQSVWRHATQPPLKEEERGVAR